MKVTVIISYYKALENLQLILHALENQSDKRFEVIVSEDDNDNATASFLSKNMGLYSFSITHLCQEIDNGFRKNEMLNKSILASKTENLIFIDGDCVPHKHFVKNYQTAFENGYMLDGRAVLLSKRLSETLVNTKSLKGLSFFSLLLSGSSQLKDGIYFPWFPLSFKKEGRGLVGRNWGICKKELLAINGFDEDYIYAGVGEDTDVEWRLKANGVKTKSVKNKAIVYHIYHPKGYSEERVKYNLDKMANKLLQNKIRCLNGIEKLA